MPRERENSVCLCSLNRNFYSDFPTRRIGGVGGSSVLVGRIIFQEAVLGFPLDKLLSLF